MKTDNRQKPFLPAALMGAIALLYGVLSACGTTHGEPELALLYNKSAQYHRPDRNPIIAVPGILGSKLKDLPSERIVWGAFEPKAADPANARGARLVALPIEKGKKLADLQDEVVPDGVLEELRIRLLGVPIEIQAYAGILRTLGAGGYRDETLGLGGKVDYGKDHFTCFQFDYDWRRDNVENAGRLHRFILKKRDYVRRQYKIKYGLDVTDIKFDIAAHSMGGLVVRYFLMYGSQDLPEDGALPELTWEGAGYVERVILVGTPNAGSLDALFDIVQGSKLSPVLPLYPPALVGTFPSVYQLLPRSRHGRVVWDQDNGRPVEDLLDPALWEKNGWGLMDPKQKQLLEVLMPDIADADKRRDAAFDLQGRILRRAKAFQRALDRPAEAPEHLRFMAVVGDTVATSKRASIDSADGSLRVIEKGPGDGTVLRSSALMDERVGRQWSPWLRTPIDFDTTLFLPEDHVTITQNATFQDNILFWLLEAPR